jgi:hypothetical protein
MKALQAYVQRTNSWTALFNSKDRLEIDTAAGRKRVAQHIDAALSPENLTCDGELSRSQVNARYKELTAAAKDLIKLDPAVAQYMYEFA